MDEEETVGVTQIQGRSQGQVNMGVRVQMTRRLGGWGVGLERMEELTLREINLRSMQIGYNLVNAGIGSNEVFYFKNTEDGLIWAFKANIEGGEFNMNLSCTHESWRVDDPGPGQGEEVSGQDRSMGVEVEDPQLQDEFELEFDEERMDWEEVVFEGWNEDVIEDELNAMKGLKSGSGGGSLPEGRPVSDAIESELEALRKKSQE